MQIPWARKTRGKLPWANSSRRLETHETRNAAPIPLFSTRQEATSHQAGSASLPVVSRVAIATYRASFLLPDSTSTETAHSAVVTMDHLLCRHLRCVSSTSMATPPPPHGESQTSSSIRTSLHLLGFLLLSVPLTGPC